MLKNACGLALLAMGGMSSALVTWFFGFPSPGEEPHYFESFAAAGYLVGVPFWWWATVLVGNIHGRDRSGVTRRFALLAVVLAPTLWLLSSVTSEHVAGSIAFAWLLASGVAFLYASRQH